MKIVAFHPLVTEHTASCIQELPGSPYFTQHYLLPANTITGKQPG
ncbi:hypothetical protein [Niastella yeongjuensis]|nr:hypothetical protein [Niastella yeongjuensis]SEP40542.1 hypothetical protein SAMN05660816_05810 [Niastella yeongjuensis]